MQRSIENIVGYAIKATDGELGKVSEFYFDDLTWSIRYLVVETGNWLSERKVLIPHAALGITDWMTETFQVNLTMDQVRNSPDFESEKTVSRQHEIDMFNHYGLPVYWGDVFYDGLTAMPPIAPLIDDSTVLTAGKPTKNADDNPHLRSTEKVKGYYIQANDGEIGHVEDFIVDDEKWNLCFLVVDTNNWLPGRKVLISPFWINKIDWAETKVFVNLSIETIKTSPAFDPSKPIGMDYHTELFAHYEKHLSAL